jgi:ParB family chromosome partitioning protein
VIALEIQEIPIDLLREAPWNPNEADEPTLRRLGSSLQRFGIVVPLVVRALGDAFEVLSGNQRLRVLREQRTETAPCVEVEADDTQARLLTQALNAIHGEDDLNRKAALVKEILAAMPAEEVAAILPGTADALRGLSSIGQTSPESLGDQLAAWSQVQQARAAVKLHVTSFPFSDQQKEVVEEAVARALPRVTGSEAPNRRALALVAVCTDWLQGRGFSEERPARQSRTRRPAVSPAVTPQIEEESTNG